MSNNKIEDDKKAAEAAKNAAEVALTSKKNTPEPAPTAKDKDPASEEQTNKNETTPAPNPGKATSDKKDKQESSRLGDGYYGAGMRLNDDLLKETNSNLKKAYDNSPIAQALASPVTKLAQKAGEYNDIRKEHGVGAASKQIGADVATTVGPVMSKAANSVKSECSSAVQRFSDNCNVGTKIKEMMGKNKSADASVEKQEEVNNPLHITSKP